MELISEYNQIIIPEKSVKVMFSLMREIRDTL